MKTKFKLKIHMFCFLSVIIEKKKENYKWKNIQNTWTRNSE